MGISCWLVLFGGGGMLLIASSNFFTHRVRRFFSFKSHAVLFACVLNFFGFSFGLKGDTNGWHDGSLDGMVLLELLGEVLVLLL